MSRASYPWPLGPAVAVNAETQTVDVDVNADPQMIDSDSNDAAA